MKVGDLVKMKYSMFWILKKKQHPHYTEQPLIVMELAYNAVKILYPDGSIKSDLVEHYEVINEGR